MNFKKGFNIKPLKVDTNGEVIFTDGTKAQQANQIACEAYGYKYNKQLGICQSYSADLDIQRNTDLTSAQLLGNNNKTSKSVNTVLIGSNNRLLQKNNNVLVVGEKNLIDHEKKNCLILGTRGKITHDNEIAIGGGSYNTGTPGLTQYSVLQVSGKTTTASDVNLNIEGAATGTEITLPANSVTTYEIWLSGLVSGGTSGTPGDYETYEYHGTIRTADNGTMTHNAKISRLLGRTGSLGTQTIDTSTAYTLRIQIIGQNNVNCQWHAVVKLHINRTIAATF